MKKAHFILFILIVLLVLPTVTSAKPPIPSKSFLPLGTIVYTHEYNNIPFHMYGATLSVYNSGATEEDDPYFPARWEDTYPFPENRDYYASKIHFLQNAAWAALFEDGDTLGQVTVCYRDGSCEDALDLTIGVNTEEWACDRPDVSAILAHTKVKPAWSEWDWNPDFAPSPFFAHAFYASVDTNPTRILDNVTLYLVEEDDWAGVNIGAITLEFEEAYTVLGSGAASCNNGYPCALGVKAQRNDKAAWPKGDVFFRGKNDIGEEFTFIANDIRRYGISSSTPGAIFITGYGSLDYVTSGYRFSLFVKDNAFRIIIISPDGPDYYRMPDLVPLSAGGIIIE